MDPGQLYLLDWQVPQCWDSHLVPSWEVCLLGGLAICELRLPTHHERLLIVSMLPIYVTVCVHAIFVCLILFVLPESLSSESRQILSKNAELARAAAKRQDALDREWESTPRHRGDPSERDPLLHGDSTFSRISGTDATHSRRRKRIMGNARRAFRRLFSFLQPLTIFAPRELEDGRKDWNLTKVGAGMFLLGLLYVSLFVHLVLY